jgi:hypothetical protein
MEGASQHQVTIHLRNLIIWSNHLLNHKSQSEISHDFPFFQGPGVASKGLKVTIWMSV